MIELDDLTLRRAQAGDTAAQRALVVLYQARVFGFCRRVLARSDGAAEDAAQEALIATLAALGTYKPDGSARLSSWILSIAYRKCMDALRAQSTAQRVLAAVPAIAAVRHGDGGTLSAAVAALTPDHRAVLLLCDLYEFTYAEAADAMGVAVGTVRSRLSRARAAVRVAYAQGLEPPVKGVAR